MCFSWNKSEVDIGDTNAIWNIVFLHYLYTVITVSLIVKEEMEHWTLCQPEGIEKQPQNSILFSPIYEVIWGR